MEHHVVAAALHRSLNKAPQVGTKCSVDINPVEEDDWRKDVH